MGIAAAYVGLSLVLRVGTPIHDCVILGGHVPRPVCLRFA
jgi:hypothetical protein